MLEQKHHVKSGGEAHFHNNDKRQNQAVIKFLNKAIANKAIDNNTKTYQSVRNKFHCAN